MRIGTQGRTPQRAGDPQDGADARWLADAVLLVLGMFGVHRFRRGQVPTAMAVLGLTLVGLWTLPVGVVGVVPLGVAGFWSMLDMIRDPGFRDRSTLDARRRIHHQHARRDGADARIATLPNGARGPS